jgi:drug/metabolite transporter (DMT)-like permease
MNKKIIGIVLLVIGVALLVWGYNISQSVSGQVSQAFSGSPGDKAMFMYIGGAICAAVGLFSVIKK